MSLTDPASPGDPHDPLQRSFLQTLRDSELRSVIESGAEVVVDSFLKEGIARDIPIVGTIAGLARTGVVIRDRLFLNKLLRFLHPFAKYSAEERKRYLSDLDQNELNKASQYLILYIDRLDSIEKSWMLSTVFEAYMLQKITYRQMLYFIHFIDAVFILVWQDYYDALKRWRPHHVAHALNIATDDAIALEKVGFYVEETEPVKTELRAGVNWREQEAKRQLRGIKRKLVLTDFGWDFIEVVFNLWPGNSNRLLLRSALTVTLNRV